MVQQNTPARLNPAEEVIQVGVTPIRFLVTGAESNGSMASFEMTIPAGATRPAFPHSHDTYEETIYGLEGVLTFTVNGQKIAIGPGEVLCIPRGAVHRFDNFGPANTQSLAIVTPGVLGPDYFREIAAVVAGSSGGPPDPAAIVAVMRRHGLTPAP